MRRLVIVSGVAIALVVGIAIYALLALDELGRYGDSLVQALEERAATLRGLDERFPFDGRATLDPERFRAHLEARRAPAELYARCLAEPGGRKLFRAYEARNQALGLLASGLEARRMGLAEYLAITQRWQAILARGGHAALRSAWDRDVAPAGLDLPDPAADADERETALVEQGAKELEETLPADLLRPVLERFAQGGG